MPSAFREYLNAKDFIKEARAKLKDYDAIMGQTKARYEELKKTGIASPAFPDAKGEFETIYVTNKCWRHVFEHPRKRRTPVERLARALTFASAIKLLEKNTTYQEVSISKKKHGKRPYYEFGLIGYIRGNRIKVVIRQDIKHTNRKKILFSFYQMSSAPRDRQRKALDEKRD